MNTKKSLRKHREERGRAEGGAFRKAKSADKAQRFFMIGVKGTLSPCGVRGEAPKHSLQKGVFCMADIFNEQIVKRQSTARDAAIRVCLVILLVLIGVFSFVFLNIFALMVIFGTGYGAFFLMSYLNVEYEYTFTSGELDIDIIYNRARRKRLLSVNLKQIEIMAHIDDPNHSGTFKSAQEIRDYSSGTKGDNTYAFLAVIDGKKTKVIIEPNDKMLKTFSKVLTRRNLHLRPGVVII